MDRHQRIEAVRKRLREMQIEERTAEMAGPPCLDCVHVIDGRQAPACGHLVYTKRTYAVTTGGVIDEQQTPAAWARADDGLCGPEAILFEPLPVTERVRRFFAKGRHQARRRYSSSVNAGS